MGLDVKAFEAKWVKNMGKAVKFSPKLEEVLADPSVLGHFPRTSFPGYMFGVAKFESLFSQLMRTEVVERSAKVVHTDESGMFLVPVAHYANGMVHAVPVLMDRPQSGIVSVRTSDNLVPVTGGDVLPFGLRVSPSGFQKEHLYYKSGSSRISSFSDTQGDTKFGELSLNYSVTPTSNIRCLGVGLDFTVKTEELSNPLDDRVYALQFSWQRYFKHSEKPYYHVPLKYDRGMLCFDDKDGVSWRCFFKGGNLLKLEGTQWRNLYEFDRRETFPVQDISSDGCTGARTFLDTYFLGIQDQKVDWDATMKGLIRGETHTLVYTGE